MDFWKKLNNDATRLFNSKQYLKAINQYILALEHSLVLLDKSSNTRQAVQNFTTSLHGLSESYLQIGEYQHAASSSIRGHKLMLNLIDLKSTQPMVIEYFRCAKRQLESYLAYLICEYPQIHICSHCHQQIFGYVCTVKTTTQIQ